MQVQFLGITMGDPAGVGPEVIAKSLKLRGETFPQCIIFGSPEIIEDEFKKVNFPITFHVIDDFDEIKPLPLKQGILLYRTLDVPKKYQ